MDNVILLYLVVVNIIGFLIMGIDKAKAKAKAWRIPEKTLLGIAVLGGAIGVWLGMETFRHKTKHPQFKYGLPLILIIELLVWFYFS
ncbi:MAG: DUF1294 domain-containing protein [Agathobacter sp.]|nr:DUF1294 domain-containing protein [Agathobacter sp.]